MLAEPPQAPRTSSVSISDRIEFRTSMYVNPPLESSSRSPSSSCERTILMATSRCCPLTSRPRCTTANDPSPTFGPTCRQPGKGHGHISPKTNVQHDLLQPAHRLPPNSCRKSPRIPGSRSACTPAPTPAVVSPAIVSPPALPPAMAGWMLRTTDRRRNERSQEVVSKPGPDRWLFLARWMGEGWGAGA
jgi:hypothetical protein